MQRSAFFNKNVPHGQGGAAVMPVVSESIVAQASFTLLASQASNRSLRFPSSRKFLWDRTPLGRSETFGLTDKPPVVSVPSDLHRRLGPGDAATAFVTCPNNGNLHITLYTGASSHESASGYLPVPVIPSSGGADQLALLLQNLLQNLQHGLDRRGAARLTTGLALVLACDSRNSSASARLTVTLLLPAVALTLTPLYAKRLCDAPLAQTLAQRQGPETSAQTGYLTMDQARSLLPLAADDPNVYSVPLVGVWVRGVRGLEHPLVYGAALQFAYCSTLPDRAVQPDGSFLLLVFTGESPVPRCYEARFTDPAAKSQAPPSNSRDAGDLLFSPTGGGCDAVSASLRVVPYVAKAELAGQTSAPLDLKPVLDSITAAAAGPRLTLPSRNMTAGPMGQTPQRSAHAAGLGPMDTATPRAGVGSMSGYGSRPASASTAAATAVGGSVSRYDAYGMYQLRGSGSKLMTSPSKAMKILPGEVGGGGGPWQVGAWASGVGMGTGVSGRVTWGAPGTPSGGRPASAAPAAGAGGAGCGGGLLSHGTSGPAAAPWAASGPGPLAGGGPQRDSPPVPRSSAVPTPFRTGPGPGLAEDSGRGPGSVHQGGGLGGPLGCGGGGGIGVAAAAQPRDPRLQHRDAPGVEAVSDRPASAGPRPWVEEGSAWTSAARGTAMPAAATTTATAAASAGAVGGDLPALRAVRVSMAAPSVAGTPAVAAMPVRAGSADWGEPPNGVMGTPAAALARRYFQSFGAPSPAPSYDVAGRQSQLLQRLHTTDTEVRQQQQPQPQHPQRQSQHRPLPPASQIRAQQPGTWGESNALGGTAPGPSAGGPEAVAEQPLSATASGSTARAHVQGFSTTGYGQAPRVGFTSAGMVVGAGVGTAGASVAAGGSDNMPTSARWQPCGGSAGGAAAAGGSTAADAVASQSLDGWLRASGRFALSDCSSEMNAHTMGGSGPVASSAAAPGAADILSCNVGGGRHHGGNNGGGDDSREIRRARPWHGSGADQTGVVDGSGALASSNPPSRPASADPYRQPPGAPPSRWNCHQAAPQPASQAGGVQAQHPWAGTRYGATGHGITYGAAASTQGLASQSGDVHWTGRQWLAGQETAPPDSHSKQHLRHTACQPAQQHPPQQPHCGEPQQRQPSCQNQPNHHHQQEQEQQQQPECLPPHPHRHLEQPGCGMVQRLVLPDRDAGMTLAVLEQEEAEDEEDPPEDPVLLKLEVLRLRRQVAELQRQLQSVAAADQRLLLSCGGEDSAAKVSHAAANIRRDPAAACTASDPITSNDDGSWHQTAQAPPSSLPPSLPPPPQIQQQAGGAPPSQQRDYSFPAARTTTTTAHNSFERVSAVTSSTLAPHMPGKAEAWAVAANSPGLFVSRAWSAGAAAGGAAGDNAQQPGAAGHAAAATSTGATVVADAAACDRVDHMSVVSEASDRGSVWSMASLRSSILSYHTCRSGGTSRPSTDGGGGVPGCNVYSACGSARGGAFVEDSAGGDSRMLDQSSTSPNCGDGRGPDLKAAGERPGSGDARELPAPAPEHGNGPRLLGGNPEVAGGAAMLLVPAAAATSSPAVTGRPFHGNGSGATPWQGQASRGPSLLPPPRNAAGGMTASRLPYVGGQPQPWERLVASDVGRRSRRRARQTSSGSDSDHSLPSEPEEAGPAPPRPSAAVTQARALGAPHPPESWWRAPPTSAPDSGHSALGAGASLHALPPRTSASAALSPRASVGSGSAAAAAATAAAVGPLVRTTYVPLDDDSDSSDSESELLLMQKYGISAL